MTQDIGPALTRLFTLAKSDTGQARCAANFLLAWWNGNDWGHFDISDLFVLDVDVAKDIAAVVAYLAEYPGAIYADAFGYRGAMGDLIEHWRC